MNAPACPYLTCEKATIRTNLDLSEPAQLMVIVTWYCEHPFHGIRLELGDARADVERHCSICTLPQPESDGE